MLEDNVVIEKHNALILELNTDLILTTLSSCHLPLLNHRFSDSWEYQPPVSITLSRLQIRVARKGF